ncbi:hypothetical protein [Mycobacterium marinum]|uniref:hypothetical protein n=1 Tax=Mycobacterium marinum TaxID=1781 RepID=UPI003563710A
MVGPATPANAPAEPAKFTIHQNEGTQTVNTEQRRAQRLRELAQVRAILSDIGTLTAAEHELVMIDQRLDAEHRRLADLAQADPLRAAFEIGLAAD